MSKKELTMQIAENFSDLLSKTNAEKITNFIFNCIKNTLIAKKEVSIVGFGKFIILQRAERKGRNPLTGEIIKISASKTIKFKISKQLKNDLNININ